MSLPCVCKKNICVSSRRGCPKCADSIGRCALQGSTLCCRQAIAEIDALVDRSIPERDPLEMDSEAASSGNGGTLDLEGGLEALGPFFSANEGFRGQIRHDVLKAANSQVQWITHLPQGSMLSFMECQ